MARFPSQTRRYPTPCPAYLHGLGYLRTRGHDTRGRTRRKWDAYYTRREVTRAQRPLLTVIVYAFDSWSRCQSRSWAQKASAAEPPSIGPLCPEEENTIFSFTADLAGNGYK